MKNIYFLAALLVSSVCMQAQNEQPKEMNQMIVDVVFLASNYMEGRYTGSAGEERAAAYIVDRFAESGLTPGGHDKTWYQPFTFTITNPHGQETGKTIQGKNVIGFLNNGAPTTIILGAHYDHLGYGESGAMDIHDKEIHNGADDNASGIASLFYMAKTLKKSGNKSHNYLFIAFSGEEQGLHGSKAFTKDPSVDFNAVDFMINLDMVGRLEADKPLMIYGVGTSPSWNPLIQKISIYGIKGIKTTVDGIGPSDHTSFYLKDIPVLHFFTGQHKEYHKSTDDARLINFNGIKLVSDYILAVISALDSEEKLVFTKTKSTERKAAAFKVTLGVMPDYSYEGEGMKIDAVMDDRPAQIAGIQDGDLVIEMDGTAIKDIYTYMEVLAANKKGNKIPVKVKRGDEIVKVEVTF